MPKKKEYEEIIHDALHRQNEAHSQRHVHQWKHYKDVLRTFLPVPIIIGAVASIIFYKIYGPEDLIRVMLSWTIGITFVATLSATLVNKLEKKQ